MTDQVVDEQLDRQHPDVIAALEVWDSARRALGPNLGGHSLVDLLADNFPWPLARCREIAAVCQELRS